MNCEYCKHTFKTKTALNVHVKTAKYCLSNRNIKIEEYKCESCNKVFSTKTNLNRHQTTCTTSFSLSEKINLIEQLNSKLSEKDILIDEQEKTILDQKNTIKDLQDKLENVAIHAVSRPTTSTIKNTQINYIQQMKPVIDDELKDNAQNLTIDHILKGPEGYAQYALDYPLKDRVCCVDYARRKVKFKDPNGNVITDPEMSTLATKFFQSIKDKNKDLIIEYGTKLNDHLG